MARQRIQEVTKMKDKEHVIALLIAFIMQTKLQNGTVDELFFILFLDK